MLLVPAVMAATSGLNLKLLFPTCNNKPYKIAPLFYELIVIVIFAIVFYDPYNHELVSRQHFIVMVYSSSGVSLILT